jgi:hypothetical protein
VDRDLITKLIETHLEMYFGGRGGKYVAAIVVEEADTTSQSVELPTSPTANPMDLVDIPASQEEEANADMVAVSDTPTA